jgi:hypothetical protein
MELLLIGSELDELLGRIELLLGRGTELLLNGKLELLLGRGTELLLNGKLELLLGRGTELLDKATPELDETEELLLPPLDELGLPPPSLDEDVAVPELLLGSLPPPPPPDEQDRASEMAREERIFFMLILLLVVNPFKLIF